MKLNKQHELEEHTREIRDLQSEFALLEEQLEREEDDERANEMQSEQDREAVAEERLSNEIAELRQEVALLQEAQQSIADTQQVGTFGPGLLFIWSFGKTDRVAVGIYSRRARSRRSTKRSCSPLTKRSHT